MDSPRLIHVTSKQLPVSERPWNWKFSEFWSRNWARILMSIFKGLRDYFWESDVILWWPHVFRVRMVKKIGISVQGWKITILPSGHHRHFSRPNDVIFQGRCHFRVATHIGSCYGQKLEFQPKLEKLTILPFGFRHGFSRACVTNFAIPTPHYVAHTHLGLVRAKNGISTRDWKNDRFAPGLFWAPNFLDKFGKIIFGFLAQLLD